MSTRVDKIQVVAMLMQMSVERSQVILTDEELVKKGLKLYDMIELALHRRQLQDYIGD